MGEVVNKVSEACNHDAVIVTDVGQHQMMASRYFKFKQTRSVVTSGGLGTMGFGLPAAMGAKLGAPDRAVVLLVGDGGFQMTVQHRGSIHQTTIPVMPVLPCHGCLVVVRHWQDLFFDSRYSFSKLINPAFQPFAKAYSLETVKATKPEGPGDAIKHLVN